MVRINRGIFAFAFILLVGFGAPAISESFAASNKPVSKSDAQIRALKRQISNLQAQVEILSYRDSLKEDQIKDLNAKVNTIQIFLQTSNAAGN